VTPVARVALGVFLVAAAGPVGFLMYRVVFSGRLPPPPQHSATLKPDATATPAAASGPATTAGGGAARGSSPERLPAMTFEDAAGAPHPLSEWSGHPLIVNFWATWCEPCRREIPLLKSLRGRSFPPGLQVVGIAVDMRDAVVKYVSDMHIDYPVLLGEQNGLQAVQALGMDTVFPFSVFVDSQGRIVTTKVGELHPDEADLILGRLAELEAGRATLPAARQQISDGLRSLAIERAKHAG
jgi:thiol-disulfide isomerase/thioredoxin